MATVLSSDVAVVLPPANLGSQVIAANIERVRVRPVGDGARGDRRGRRRQHATTRCSKRCGPPRHAEGVRVLRHEVNRGKGQALFTGARATRRT